MTAFVLVPGACHGGWWYDPLVQALTAAGHSATALTLVGLEDEPDIDRRITLDTHTDQVASAVQHAAAAAEASVVLVGHSYAGVPCVAAADRSPDRVAALVLLDAFLPADGDSCWSLTNDEQREWYATGCAAEGDGVAPLPFFDERARPHPIGTLLQTVHLTGAWEQVPVRHYAAASWPGESPMARSRARAAEDEAFAVHDWDTRHNVLHDGPERVLELLRQLTTRTT